MCNNFSIIFNHKTLQYDGWSHICIQTINFCIQTRNFVKSQHHQIVIESQPIKQGIGKLKSIEQSSLFISIPRSWYLKENAAEHCLIILCMQTLSIHHTFPLPQANPGHREPTMKSSQHRF